jgi:multicomponent Na+:H+ antiporter subunit C
MISFAVLLLFTLGLWGVLAGKTLIRKIIGITVLNSSVVILYIMGGLAGGESAPILTAAGSSSMVDPLPQALMLTAIVVGLSVNALALILSIRIHRSFGSGNIEQIEETMKEEEDEFGF